MPRTARIHPDFPTGANLPIVLAALLAGFFTLPAPLSLPRPDRELFSFFIVSPFIVNTLLCFALLNVLYFTVLRFTVLCSGFVAWYISNGGVLATKFRVICKFNSSQCCSQASLGRPPTQVARLKDQRIWPSSARHSYFRMQINAPRVNTFCFPSQRTSLACMACTCFSSSDVPFPPLCHCECSPVKVESAPLESSLYGLAFAW